MPGRSVSAAMLFSVLAPSLQDALRRAAPIRHFVDGQLVQQKGDTAHGFWLIEEGAVAAGEFLADGEFRSVALLAPGDSYGELALLSGNRRIFDSVARGSTALRYIDGAAFERELAADPSAMRALLGALAAQLQELLDLHAGIRRNTTAARASALLANLAGNGTEPRDIAITQQDLADLLGLTRATANAVLRKLERSGLIERRYGAIRVPDPSQLRLASRH